MRKHATTLLKIAVTVVGLVIILRQVEPAEIAATLLQADWRWILLSFLIFNASLVFRAYRWLLLLRGLGKPIRFLRLVELYFAGNFFNAFLPTSFGGDVVRAWEAADDVSPDAAAGTVIVDRLTGLMALLVMALVALPLRPAYFPQSVLIVTVTLSLLGLLGGVLLLDGSLFRRFGDRLPGPLSPEGSGFVARTLLAVQSCGWPAIVRALLVSGLFNLMLTGWWWTTARSLGLDVSYIYLLLVIPILSIVLLIPSIGGLGPREVIAPLLFAGAGISAGDAYALSLLVFLMQRVSGIIGGVWYLWATLRAGRWRSRKSRREEPVELTTGEGPANS